MAPVDGGGGGGGGMKVEVFARRTIMASFSLVSRLSLLHSSFATFFFFFFRPSRGLSVQRCFPPFFFIPGETRARRSCATIDTTLGRCDFALFGNCSFLFALLSADEKRNTLSPVFRSRLSFNPPPLPSPSLLLIVFFFLRAVRFGIVIVPAERRPAS